MSTRAEPAIVELLVDGAPLDAAAAAALTALTVHQRQLFPAQLEATFLLAARRSAGPVSWPPVGARLVATVAAGQELFAGRVAAIERAWSAHGARALTIRAYDRLHELRRSRLVGSYRDVPVAEVIRQLVERNGLTLDDRAGLAGRDTVTLQYGETDLALLHRLAWIHDLTIEAAADTVVIAAGDRPARSARLRLGVDLIQLAVDQRAEDDTEEPVVIGWHQSSSGTVGDAAGSIHAGWLVDADRAATMTASLRRAGGADRVVASGRAVGDPRLRPGTALLLDGDGIDDLDAFAGDLVITSATHTLSPSEGYVTELSTEPAPRPATAPAAAGSAASTLGTVVDLDDPDRLGRLRVALPAYDGIETSWLPIAGLGVGADRGVVAVPDVGDQVLVLGPADDVGTGVVLGGVAVGGAGLAGDPVSDGASRRIVACLPGGARLVVADDGVVVEDGVGSRLAMGSDRVVLHAGTDLEIAAPGQHLLIRAESIDFEQA